MRITLRDPSLVVLVGVAASGKSTLAARLFPPDAVLSSDRFRGIVAGNEADQSATRVAFSILHRELSKRLAAGRTTVVDATNVTAYARRGLAKRAALAGVPAAAIVLDLKPALVGARNALRDTGRVPMEAMRNQWRDLQKSIRRGFDDEGFAAVHILRTPEEVEALEIDWI